MAVAAFKSTSRRATTNPLPQSFSSDKETSKERVPTSPKKPNPPPPPPRRSRSVSAVSRSNLDNTSTSASSDFLLTTRDNPLYWTATTSPRDGESCKDGVFGCKSLEINDSSRGRSVSRNSLNRKEIVGRSLSRVDTGRRNRSVSRGPVSRGNSINSESELEQEGSTKLLRKQTTRSSLNSVSSVGRSSIGGNGADKFTSPAQLDGSAKNVSPLPIVSWEDGNVGGNSFSEAEEKTIKAVFEQMKCDVVQSLEGDNLGGDASSRIYETVRSEVRRAIADIQNDLESAMRRSNAAAIATTSVTDIPPDLVNPSAVELVLDIRREYASKLEESLERARKLRADLAVEEHRGLELSRILKEVLPDPKTPSVQKSRPVRKASIERRRMSRRLTEEAMAYFDECVSLSTFDSSDFSSQEDPPINIVGSDTPFSEHGSISHASHKTRVNYGLNSSHNDKQECGSAYNRYASGLSATSSNKDRPADGAPVNSTGIQRSPTFRFSFSHKPDDSFELQQDIRKYVQNIEKNDDNVPVNSGNSKSNGYHHLDEYDLHDSSENLLFDMVVLKSRVESGGMLLCCGGGLPISLSPFSSLL